jgi:hypothetical protein
MALASRHAVPGAVASSGRSVRVAHLVLGGVVASRPLRLLLADDCLLPVLGGPTEEVSGAGRDRAQADRLVPGVRR